MTDKMFQSITKLLRSGRPGDYQHIKSLYAILVKGYEKGELAYDSRIMLPATLLHDVGFGFIKTAHMHYFTGQKKVNAMRDAVQEITLGFVPAFLAEYEMTPEDIEKIVYIIRYSDDETLSVPSPSQELILLHDLNLYDRLLPHRIRAVKKMNTDKVKLETVLRKSVAAIINPMIRSWAESKLETTLASL